MAATTWHHKNASAWKRREDFICLVDLVPGFAQFFFKINDLFDLRQEPMVDFGEIENLVEGETGAQGVADEKDALGVGDAQLARDDVAGKDVAVAVNLGADAPGLAIAAK